VVGGLDGSSITDEVVAACPEAATGALVEVVVAREGAPPVAGAGFGEVGPGELDAAGAVEPGDPMPEASVVEVDVVVAAVGSYR
jgi:hypothetical protein